MAASHTSGFATVIPFKLVQAGSTFSGTKPTPVASLLRDMQYGGMGVVIGTVKEKNTPANTPVRRRVVLIDERSRHVIRETWSAAATGNYEFRGVNPALKYTVLSYDHTNAYNGVVATGITPEAMT